MVNNEIMTLFVLAFKSDKIDHKIVLEHGIGITSAGNQSIACVLESDINKAKNRLETFIEKQNGIILPIPIDEGELESMLWGIRCGKSLFIEMILRNQGNILIPEDLKSIKKQLYEGIERKKRQIKRAQILIKKIEELESTENNDLIPNILDEIFKLGIVWKPYEVAR